MPATAPWLEVLYGLLLLTGIARDAAAVLARWWLGCVFIYMGLNKALPHPEYFLKLVRQYDMVTSPLLLNSIGAALPWFEVFCGLLLLVGVAVRGSALNADRHAGALHADRAQTGAGDCRRLRHCLSAP